MNGSVPRILDDGTWAAVQARLQSRADQEKSRLTRTIEVKPNSTDRPSRRPLQLALFRKEPEHPYRCIVGTPRQLQKHTSEFGRALCARLRASGLAVAFDPRINVLTSWDIRLRVRLMWPDIPSSWVLARSRTVTDVPNLLVARMAGLGSPHDFFMLRTHALPSAFSGPLRKDVPRELRRYWCESGVQVLERIAQLCTLERHSRPAKASASPFTIKHRIAGT